MRRRKPLRRGKFGAIRTEYRGREYASKLEAREAARLDLQRSVIGKDRVVEVRAQVPVKLEVNGKLICRYICDFVVTYADGRTEWRETKGYDTATWKLKEKLFRAIYPERRLVVVRSSANRDRPRDKEAVRLALEREAE